ncbi:MAG: hypothetical protein AB1410_10790 [Acidobacteriota bacterium]
MKKIFLLLILMNSFIFSQNIESLLDCFVRKVSNSLNFDEQRRISIKEFVNLSERDSYFLQNVYQLMRKKFEDILDGKVIFGDYILSFDDSGGYVDQPYEEKIDYYVFLYYWEDAKRIGISAKLYDGKIEQLINFVFCSGKKDEREIDIFRKPLSVSKIHPFIQLFKSSPFFFKILDACIIDENKLGILTSDKFFIYSIKEKNLIEEKKISLDWRLPLYPSQDEVGKILKYNTDDKEYIILSSSFSDNSILYQVQGEELVLSRYANFVPLIKLRIGDNKYVLFSDFQNGKNYFTGQISLIKEEDIFLNEGDSPVAETLKYNLVPFYSIQAMNDENGEFIGIYLVDEQGKLRYFNKKFKEIGFPESKVGDQLCVIENILILTEHSSEINKDQLNFKVANGLQKIGEAKIDGNILSLSEGKIEDENCFVTVEKFRTELGTDEYVISLYKRRK